MKTLITLSFLLSFNTFSNITVRPECYKSAQEEIMFMDSFPWNQSKEEFKSNFETLYNSGMRMANRVFFDGENFMMPFDSYSYGVQYANVPELFLKSLVANIEAALENDYVDYISFSDMGHNHLFIPLDFYNGELAKYDASSKHKRYEAMMSNPDLLMLYHTAEQLKFFEKRGDKLPIGDRYIQKRFYTRNLLGRNDGSKDMKILFELEASGQGTNTYKPKSYRYWGAGFSFNSTINGCFSYKKNGKEFYFDISPDDVGYKQTDDYYEYLKGNASSKGTLKCKTEKPH